MNRTKFSRLILASGVILGAGLIAAFAGFFSYMTRYANLDSLDGTVDEAVYKQIIQMFAPEKVFLSGGAKLVIIGAIGIALGLAAESKAVKRSN